MDESIIPKKIFNLGKVCIESWISLPLLFILWGNPRIIPDDPPIVNINKKRKTKNVIKIPFIKAGKKEKI